MTTSQSKLRCFSICTLGVLLLSLSACGGSSGSCALSLTGTAFAADSGTAQVSGRVTFPTGTSKGLQVDLFVNSGGARSAVLSDKGILDTQTSCGAGTFDYVITKLPAASYAIEVALQDISNSSAGSDPKFDFIGFYNGTIAAPITDVDSAKSVDLADGAKVSAIDFYVGKAP